MWFGLDHPIVWNKHSNILVNQHLSCYSLMDLQTGWPHACIGPASTRSPGCLHDCSWRLLDDPLHLASIDAKFAGNGSLAGTGFVPRSYRLLQCWRLVLQGGRTGACSHDRQSLFSRPTFGPDEHHEQLEGTGQRQGGPGAPGHR